MLNRRGRLIWQYRNKPKAEKLVKILTDEFDVLYKSLQFISNIYSLNNAKGSHLDLLGSYLGVGREILKIATGYFLGFYGSEKALPLNKGKLYRILAPEFVSYFMGDTNYRTILQAHPFAKKSYNTLPDLQSFLYDILNVNIKIRDLLNMEAMIIIDFTSLDTKQKELFTEINNINNILPRPQGVYYNLIELNKGSAFGIIANRKCIYSKRPSHIGGFMNTKYQAPLVIIKRNI